MPMCDVLWTTVPVFGGALCPMRSQHWSGARRLPPQSCRWAQQAMARAWSSTPTPSIHAMASSIAAAVRMSNGARRCTTRSLCAWIAAPVNRWTGGPERLPHRDCGRRTRGAKLDGLPHGRRHRFPVDTCEPEPRKIPLGGRRQQIQIGRPELARKTNRGIREIAAHAATLTLRRNGYRSQQRPVAVHLERRAADDAAGVARDEERGEMILEA